MILALHRWNMEGDLIEIIIPPVGETADDIEDSGDDNPQDDELKEATERQRHGEEKGGCKAIAPTESIATESIATDKRRRYIVVVGAVLDDRPATLRCSSGGGRAC